MTKNKKGFTLIELLVVIAILAVLTTTVVLVLNPAELVRQARDSTRISDLSSVNSAIALYLADQSTVVWNTTSTCTFATTTPPAAGSGVTTCATNVVQTPDGTGWVNVPLTSITGGSPLGKLPIDPSNNAQYLYQYKSSSTIGLYEIDANMESTKYSNGGSNDVESKDGGNNANFYEVGSGLSL